LTLESIEFVVEARKEFLALPRPLQRQLRELSPYLLTNPYRSYPWLQVRELRELPGVWRFRLGLYRVFYRVEASTLVMAAITLRPPAYTSRMREEVRRRLSASERGRSRP
jgi:mRNA-degrading endonuclease RelE of RelBE toxin-antitoxin system